MEVWATKVLVIFLAWLIICSFALMPIKVSDYFFRQGQKGRRIMGILNCFAGGIFFGSYLLHMAPEVRLLLEVSWLKPKGIVYPFPELIMGLGFFLVLYLEKFFKAMNERQKEKTAAMKRVESGGGGVSRSKYLSWFCCRREKEVREVRHENQKAVSRKRIEFLCFMCNKVKHNEVLNEGGRNEGDRDNATNIDDSEASISQRSENVESMADRSHEMNVIVKLELKDEEEEEGVQEQDERPDDQVEQPVCQHCKADMEGLDSTRSIILILSLSLHCLFEGMGCGLQMTSANVWNLFIVLSTHEWVVAFSIGLQLTKCYSTKKVIIGAFLYSLMTPSGIAIGTAISESPGPAGHNALINGILKAVAAGTFINVTFLEILKDKLSSDSSIGKIIALTLGYVLMALLSLIPIDGQGQNVIFTNNGTVINVSDT